MMRSGACAPRSASARMRSSEVGSAQCRSSNASDDRLRPRARENPCGHRRQLSAPQFLRRKLRGAVLVAAGCRPAARAGAHIRRGRGRSAASVPSRSARRCSAGASAPNRRRPHSAIGCSGVFCRSCETSIRPRCGRLAEPRVKLLDQPRLAEAGLADDQHELALALARALPAPASRSSSSSRPTKRRERARQPFGRRRSRARCDRASPASDTPLSSCAPRSSATNSPATCRWTSR